MAAEGGISLDWYWQHSEHSEKIGSMNTLGAVNSGRPAFGALVLVMAFTTILTACGTSASSSCFVPGAYKSVEVALCRADPDELRKAFATTDPSHFQSTATVLLAIWGGSEAVGKGLPMNQLQSTPVRLAFAPFLAQSIRNGRVEGDLQSIREFADRTLKAATDGSLEQVQAIGLVGAADSNQSVSFLVDMIKKTAYPTAAHIESIRALGLICDSSASNELRQLQSDAQADSPDREIIAKAIQERESLSQSWCRQR